MTRFLIYLSILFALSFFLFGPSVALSQAYGQEMGGTRSCDVLVNGITITFPKGYMNGRECQQLAFKLDLKDETGAHIQCVCQQGDRT